MSRRVWLLLLAVLCTLLGVAGVVAGVWLLWGFPAVLLVAGAGVLALGLWVVPT
jgi:hypothetical protein